MDSPLDDGDTKMNTTLRLGETDNAPLDGAASEEPPKKTLEFSRPPRPGMNLTLGSFDSDNSSQQNSQNSVHSDEPPLKKTMEFSRPSQMGMTLASIDSDHSQQDDYSRPQRGPGGRPNNLFLNFSGTLSSLGGTARSDMVLSKPSTPLPDRTEYKTITGKVDVIMFDFDGTLTATPGDRQVRSQKRIEISDRVKMLQPRLRALREAGCMLGILSKSTETTIRDALTQSGLMALFDAPVVGKAVGFEGKVGFIRNMAQAGSLRRDRRPGPDPRRILLVDDDVLELERARAQGIQTYAAPGDGGLQEEDFQIILDAMKLPPKPAPRAAAQAACFQNSFGPLRGPASRHSTPFPSSTQPWFPTKFLDKPGPPPGGKWRNLILFSGDCFEG